MNAPTTSPRYVEPRVSVCVCPACTRSPRGGRDGYCRTCAELCAPHGTALCIDAETGAPRPPPRREKPPPPAGESITAHARRVGRSVVVVGKALVRAGLKPEKGRPGRPGMIYTGEEVDRALAALDVEAPAIPPPPPPVVAPPTPAIPPDFDAVDLETGRAVWCESCVSTVACTRRRRPCRWCLAGKPPLRHGGAS
jgi:hypothetical protein